MKDSDFQKKFETALEALGERSQMDVSGLEHEVWNEIAIRGERSGGRWLSWILGEPLLVAGPAAAAVAVAAGVYLGFSRAEAYGEEASLAMEQKYVESIHPVMMSATHTDGHASR